MLQVYLQQADGRTLSEILRILLRDEILASDVDISRLAKQTESFSGSDLKREFTKLNTPLIRRMLIFSLDLCVSAALDAVKENVQLPWVTTSSIPTLQTESATPTLSLNAQSSLSESQAGQAEPVISSSISQTGTPDSESTGSSEQSRALHLRNFTKALKEITPSSSESLGSLAELRKWNEEFGEGRQSRKRQQVWGRGRFGFVEYPKDVDKVEEGKVVPTKLVRSKSKILEILDMQ